MKKIKSLLIMGLAITMVTGLFAGCGTKNVTTSQPDTKTEANVTTSGDSKDAVAEEEVQVVKWIHWVPQATVQGVIDAFEAENPNIKIEYEVGVEGDSTEHLKKLDLMILAGEKADIIITPNVSDYAARASQGMLADLDELITADGKTFDEIYSVDTRVNDKIYALPGGVVFWYVTINKDHLDEAGLPVPPLDWTWDDFAEYAKKLTQGEGATKRYGAYFHTWDNPMKLAAYNVIKNNNIYTEDMKQNFEHPVFREFLEFRYNMENTDMSAMPYYDAIASKAHYDSGFYNESFSMVPIGSWTIGGATNLEKYPHDFKTTYAPLPRWEDGGTPGLTLSENSYYSINKNSDVKEAAYKFLNFYTTEGWKYAGEGKFSAAIGADNEATLEQILSTNGDYENLVDVERLKEVINYKVENPQINIDDNIKDYTTIFKEEAEKYLVGGQDIDTTMKLINERANEIAK